MFTYCEVPIRNSHPAPPADVNDDACDVQHEGQCYPAERPAEPINLAQNQVRDEKERTGD